MQNSIINQTITYSFERHLHKLSPQYSPRLSEHSPSTEHSSSYSRFDAQFLVFSFQKLLMESGHEQTEWVQVRPMRHCSLTMHEAFAGLFGTQFSIVGSKNLIDKNRFKGTFSEWVITWETTCCFKTSPVLLTELLINRGLFIIFFC
jgi:hypothetical protein